MYVHVNRLFIFVRTNIPLNTQKAAPTTSCFLMIYNGVTESLSINVGS